MTTKLDFWAYVNPFSVKLWVFLFLVSFLFTILIVSIEPGFISTKYARTTNIIRLISTYGSVLMAYFGGAMEDAIWRKEAALRIFTLSIALLGNVVFMSYQGSLTSALATVELSLPFRDLEGLLKSDYE